MLRQPRPLNPFAFERRVFGLGLPTSNLLQLYDPARDAYADTGLTTLATDGGSVAGLKDEFEQCVSLDARDKRQPTDLPRVGGGAGKSPSAGFCERQQPSAGTGSRVAVR